MSWLVPTLVSLGKLTVAASVLCAVLWHRAEHTRGAVVDRLRWRFWTIAAAFVGLALTFVVPNGSEIWQMMKESLDLYLRSAHR